jgi:hypothetical protein
MAGDGRYACSDTGLVDALREAQRTPTRRSGATSRDVVRRSPHIDAAPVRTARKPRPSLLRREGPLVLILGVFAGLVAYRMPDELVQDSWLTLVSGRAIAHNGLHAHDTLTALTHGLPWIDQQWLAQLGYYGLAVAGGIKLAMIGHLLVLVAALGTAMAFARRLGASPVAVGFGAVLSIPVALWGLQLRSQNLACLLFVGVLGLLLLDGRGPPRRAFWTLPLLALWANLHGSVLIGAGIVVFFAVTCAVPAARGDARRSMLVRCGALAAGAVAAVFVSPYGFSLVHYYDSFFGNPDMKLVAEWRSAFALRADAYPFLIVVAIAGALVLAQRRRLSFFQIGVLVLTAVAGLQAIRNALWFSYAVALILPLAIDGTRPIRSSANRREFSRLYPLVGIPALVVALVVLVAEPESWYTKRWPDAAPAHVASAARSVPGGGSVFATERYADWILWREPQLAGRVAYDARFELLPRRVFDQIVQFAARTPGKWTRLPDRNDVLVMGTRDQRDQLKVLRRRPGRRLVYQDKTVTVLAGLPRR